MASRRARDTDTANDGAGGRQRIDAGGDWMPRDSPATMAEIFSGMQDGFDADESGLSELEQQYDEAHGTDSPAPAAANSPQPPASEALRSITERVGWAIGVESSSSSSSSPSTPTPGRARRRDRTPATPTAPGAVEFLAPHEAAVIPDVGEMILGDDIDDDGNVTDRVAFLRNIIADNPRVFLTEEAHITDARDALRQFQQQTARLHGSRCQDDNWDRLLSPWAGERVHHVCPDHGADSPMLHTEWPRTAAGQAVSALVYTLHDEFYVWCFVVDHVYVGALFVQSDRSHRTDLLAVAEAGGACGGAAKNALSFD